MAHLGEVHWAGVDRQPAAAAARHPADLHGVQLVTLGLLAELQARTYHESQNKPTYAIREILQTPIAEHAGADNVRSISLDGRITKSYSGLPSQPPASLPAFVAAHFCYAFCASAKSRHATCVGRAFTRPTGLVGAHETEHFDCGLSALVLGVMATACETSPAGLRLRPRGGSASSATDA